MMLRSVLAAGPVLVAGAAAAVIVGTSGGGPDGDARAQSGATGVATVERRTLVDSAIVAGTLGYADERSVVNRLAGTVTWLPSAGAVVGPGETLLRVDGAPVILMDGRVPAYRALRAGVSDGADVLQLERGLRALGHAGSGLEVDRHWDAATTAAVERWQAARGLEETGEVQLGRVAFLPGTRRVTEQKVDVGTAGGNATGVADVGTRTASPVLAAIGGLAGAALDTIGGAPAHAQTPPATATTPVTTTPATTTPPPRSTTTGPAATTPAAPAPSTPASADARDSALPGASASAAGADDDAAGSGSGPGGTATTVLETTSTRRVVTVALDVADQQLAAVGRRVDIELPDGSTVPGRIGRVGTVATTASGEEGVPGEEQTTTIDVSIRLTGRGRGGRLDKAPVSVSLARETRRDVLTVPVTALVARRGGGYAVQRLGTRGTRTLVDVEPGLYADGDVEILRGLRAGDRVAVPL